MAFTPKLTFAAAWLTSSTAFKAIKVFKHAKNAPNQADNFANFSEMLWAENQLFGSSAGSDLQAIKLQIFATKFVVYFTDRYLFWKRCKMTFFLVNKQVNDFESKTTLTRSNQTTNFMKKMVNFQNLLLGSREKDENRDWFNSDLNNIRSVHARECSDYEKKSFKTPIYYYCSYIHTSYCITRMPVYLIKRLVWNT